MREIHHSKNNKKKTDRLHWRKDQLMLVNMRNIWNDKCQNQVKINNSQKCASNKKTMNCSEENLTELEWNVCSLMWECQVHNLHKWGRKASTNGGRKGHKQRLNWVSKSREATFKVFSFHLPCKLHMTHKALSILVGLIAYKYDFWRKWNTTQTLWYNDRRHCYIHTCRSQMMSSQESDEWNKQSPETVKYEWKPEHKLQQEWDAGKAVFMRKC